MRSSSTARLRALGIAGVLSAAAALVAASGASPQGATAVDLSPERWSDGELETYDRLLQGRAPPPALTFASGSQGAISGTSGAPAVRAGLEALRQGGSAADAVLTTSLAQIVLATGCWVSFSGILSLVYYDAAADRLRAKTSLEVVIS